MSDDNVMVFRGPDRPVAVPEEVVLSAQREYRAYLAHQKGMSWAEVAEREKYPSADAARFDVRRYLTEGRALVTEWSRVEMLHIELARLDALQASIWDAAVGGKLPAVALARDLIMSRIKILKLDEAVDEDETRARTVVVYGDTDSYSAALEQASSD